MKIKLIETEEYKFSPNEKRMLRHIEDDPAFNELILYARQVLRIPGTGLLKFDKNEIEKLVREWQRNDDFKTVFIVASAVTSLLELPRYWDGVFSTIILFGVAFPPIKTNPIIMEYISGLNSIKEYVSEPAPSEPFIVIKIRENISRTKIRNFLENNAKKYDENRKYLPESADNRKVFTRQKDDTLDIKKRLAQLRQIGKPLEDLLREKEYTDEAYSYDTASLGVYLRRYVDASGKQLRNPDSYKLLSFLDSLLHP